MAATSALRIELAARGSLLAYGYLDAPTAPGQLSAAETAAADRGLSPLRDPPLRAPPLTFRRAAAARYLTRNRRATARRSSAPRPMQASDTRRPLATTVAVGSLRSAIRALTVSKASPC